MTLGAAVFVLIPLYAAADRLWGAAQPDFKGKKAVIAAAAVGLGFLLGGLLFALIGAAWFVYRSIPFKGGASAPVTAGEGEAAVLRHLAAVPLPVILAAALGGDVPHMILAMAGYAIAATVLAFWYGAALAKAQENGQPIGNQNQAVELARGAAFGLALAVYALL